MRWEEFDILAKGITNEDIASTTTGLTLPNGLRLTSTNMMPQDNELKKRSFSTHNMKTPSKSYKLGRKTTQYNYRPYDYVDKKDNLPTRVVYEEIDTFEDLSKHAANKLPKERGYNTSPSPRKSEIEDRPSNEKLKFKIIQPKLDQSDELLIEMDQSFNHDLRNGKSKKGSKPHFNMPMVDDHDNTLDLSPIQRSATSDVDDSFDNKDNKRQRPIREFDKESLATPVITPLYKPAEKKRESKYITLDLNKASSVQSEPSRRVKTRPFYKNNSVASIKDKYVKSNQDGFKDLMQYENFKDELKSVPEQFEEEDSSAFSRNKFHDNAYNTNGKGGFQIFPS